MSKLEGMIPSKYILFFSYFGKNFKTFLAVVGVENLWWRTDALALSMK